MSRINLLTALMTLCLVSLPAPNLSARQFENKKVEIPPIEKFVIPVETESAQIVIAVNADRSVAVRHFGAKIADPAQFVGYKPRTSRYNEKQVYPALGGRQISEPALHVKYADGSHNTELRYLSHGVERNADFIETKLWLKDYVTNLEVCLIYEAWEKEDVIVARSEIYNRSKKPVELVNVASSCLPMFSADCLLTYFNGGWSKEMQVSHEHLDYGIKLVEDRSGTQTSQAANPSFLLSLSGDYSENSGECVAGSLAWSGNYRLSFEKMEDGTVNVISGISPHACAYPVSAGGTFVTPDMIWAWSNTGAGGASRNLHRWARKTGIYGGGQQIPTILNSWEGVHFDFDTSTILGLIDDAASAGLEMFVLDDGWFGEKYPRNSDTSSLGDWVINRAKLPEGLEYIADYAHGKGLKFGLWIEPEMVSPISELAEAHPEWIVQSKGREIYQDRNQWVLDLCNPKVQDYVFSVFDGIMQATPGIDYIKWDCNRKIYSFGSPYLGKEQDRFYVDYVQGLYSVMRRIREKYPDVLIQCCASGGARVDYGAMRWFNEFWTSDNTDALSRIRIQYGTSLIYPACAMASHVSAVPNRQTGNVTPLKMRFDMAASGRLGMELQPKKLTEDELAFSRRCIASYKSFRDVIFNGDLYRISSPYDGDYYDFMYVSPNKDKAVVFSFCTRYQNRMNGGHIIALAGLDPQGKYLVKEQNVDSSCWWGDGEVFSGDFLMNGRGFDPDIRKAGVSAIFVLEKVD